MEDELLSDNDDINEETRKKVTRKKEQQIVIIIYEIKINLRSYTVKLMLQKMVKKFKNNSWNSMHVS